MGEASASASASSAIQGGGNISNNSPNYVMWVVIGVVALLAMVFFKGRKK
jgi:hypothetical protein